MLSNQRSYLNSISHNSSITTNQTYKTNIDSHILDKFFITWVGKCFLVSLKQKTTNDCLFKVKKDPSNMTYGSTEMTLNKVSNQR